MAELDWADMELHEDAALLRAIAGARDQEAFAKLFDRYHQAAYHLAYFITQDHGLAEEAVQEGMLSVWKFAGDFRTNNEARPWILRIVAHRSRRLGRKQRRREIAMREFATVEERPGAALPPAEAEQADLLAALRKALQTLPELDRELVALYFGAGLSHHEIAHDLAMPRRTVTLRIQKMLERLRGQLAGAGFASAVTLSLADRLGALVRTGATVPAGLKERTLARLGDPGLQVSARILPTHALAAVKSALWIALGGAALLALGAAGLWWSARPGSQQPAAVASATPEAVPVRTPPVRTPPVRTPPAVPPVVEAPFYRRWSFADGPAKDFTVWHGAWNWVPGQVGTRGSMQAVGEVNCIFLLPVKLPRKPCVLTLQAHELRERVPRCGSYWVAREGALPLRLRYYHSIKITKNANFKLRYAFLDRYALGFVEGQLFNVFASEMTYPMAEVAVQFSGLGLEEMEIRELRPEELTGELADPERAISSMGVKATEYTPYLLPKLDPPTSKP